MFRTTWTIALTLLALASASGAQAQAGADLNISPKRVVMRDGGRNAVVHLFNQGDDAATYTIELIDHEMDRNGEIVAVAAEADSDMVSAAPYVALTPRRVTLQPRESQAIRLRARAPEAPGEYRTHMVITALPPEDTGLTAAEAVAGGEPETLALQVLARFSLSVPIILREGAAPTSVTLEEAHLVAAESPGAPQGVAFTFVRRGEGSVYGDLEIRAGRGRDARVVGRVRGLAVYPEVDRRPFLARLDQPVRSGEEIRIVYRDDDHRPGAELAAVTFVAP